MIIFKKFMLLNKFKDFLIGVLIYFGFISISAMKKKNPGRQKAPTKRLRKGIKSHDEGMDIYVHIF